MPQFIDPFVSIVPAQKMTKEDLIRALRQDLAAEEEAAHLYTAHADACENPIAKKILNDISYEEIVHSGEFLRLLDIISEDEGKLIVQGVKEVDEKTMSLRSNDMLGKLFVAGRVVRTLLKPTSPKEGPPLPEKLGVPWPGFIKKGIEGIKQGISK